MAVSTQDAGSVSQASAGRRFMVGTNVVLATVFVIGIAVVAQLIAFRLHQRWDMTSSGVNSLSEGTENLLRHLDQNVRLTSLYFETDREDKDQPYYRRAAQDLLNLYEATNRSKVRSEWINPLKDHERLAKLEGRLRDKGVFKTELSAYKDRVDKYHDEMDPKMRELVQAERDRIAGLGTSLSGATGQTAIAQVENAFHELSPVLDRTRERIEGMTLANNPQYTRAANQLRTLYSQFSQTLKNIGQFAAAAVQRHPDLPPDQAQYLREAGSRYADLIAAIEAETQQLQKLAPLKFDDLIEQIAPTANAILVETDNDARVVDFSSVWPPVSQGAGARGGFKDRAFKGEEKLTSAILRVTHKEQTAVVFVRYGGPPLFLGGFMPGQPPAPYAEMKLHMEDANFIVDEWDVKSSETPPKIEPTPTRTIYVVLKPTPPPRGPMGRPSPEPPFGDTQRQAVLKAIRESGRALFIAGWHPGPFGPIPSTYEYNDYLTDEWGLKVDTSALLIETMNIAPGQYVVGRRDFYTMRDLSVTDHDIVSGALARKLGLPMCAPLELADPPPEGVEYARLVYLPERDGIWGESNIQQFIEQAQMRESLAQDDQDRGGPFDLAVAATKGDQKIVVVSSANFAVDNVALARDMALTSRGLTVFTRNPGNVSLLVNSLHWLNDNTEFMNIGKPIDAAVLQIGSESTVQAVQALTIFVWPVLALACGGMVWWFRRR